MLLLRGEGGPSGGRGDEAALGPCRAAGRGEVPSPWEGGGGEGVSPPLLLPAPEAPLQREAHTRSLILGTGDTAHRAPRLPKRVQVSAETERRLPPTVDGDIIHANFAWKCEAPVALHMWQKAAMDPLGAMMGGDPVQWGGEAQLLVPCRKCWPCRVERTRQWLGRAMAEVRASRKTWFVTFTFAKQPESEKEVVSHVQMALKRLRKGRAEPLLYRGQPRRVPPAKVRYLAAVERGEKNGRLHAHLLIHGDVTWMQLHACWGDTGHMQAKCVAHTDHIDRGSESDAAKAAFYVVKYVTKGSHRMIASLHYGSPDPEGRTGPHGRSVHSQSELTRSAPTSEQPEETATPSDEEGRTTFQGRQGVGSIRVSEDGNHG